MRTVHSYARFSTPKQQWGDSERRQVQDAADFVKRHGFRLSNLQLFDRGKSGFRLDKQKALNAFLAKIGTPEVNAGDILLVEAIDRLSRKGIRQTQTIVNTILNAGIDIAILRPLEKIYRADDPNDIGGAVELAAFAFAAHASSARSSGMAKSWYAKARKDAYEGKTIISGPSPSWLTRKKNGQFDYSDEAETTIKYIFRRTIEGAGGHVLCRELNAKFPPFGRSGKWNEPMIRNILRDRRVLGEFQPHEINEKGQRKPVGLVIPDYLPQIIDQKTYDLAVMASEHRRVERGPSSLFINLFTGIVFHATDGCPMQIYSYFQKRADGRRVVFRRLKGTNATWGIKGADTATIDLAGFEATILSNLRELDISIFANDKRPSEERDLLTAQITRKAKRLTELQMIEDEDADLLLPQMKKLKGELKSLRERLAHLTTASEGLSL